MNNARLDKSRSPNDFVGNDAFGDDGINLQWIPTKNVQLYKVVKIWIMGIYPSENVLVHYQKST